MPIWIIKGGDYCHLCSLPESLVLDHDLWNLPVNSETHVSTQPDLGEEPSPLLPGPLETNSSALLCAPHHDVHLATGSEENKGLERWFII